MNRNDDLVVSFSCNKEKFEVVFSAELTNEAKDYFESYGFNVENNNGQSTITWRYAE